MKWIPRAQSPTFLSCHPVSHWPLGHCADVGQPIIRSHIGALWFGRQQAISLLKGFKNEILSTHHRSMKSFLKNNIFLISCPMSFSKKYLVMLVHMTILQDFQCLPFPNLPVILCNILPRLQLIALQSLKTILGFKDIPF